MQQNTPEWLEWRQKGIGASDIAAIIGASPYSTPYMVWLDKTGRKKAFEGNVATVRGQELESKARSRYELETLEDMPPAMAVHPKFEICRVSLDGKRLDNKLILEIKCPGEANHKLAMGKIIPAHYVSQVQYQLAVTGADCCHYFSFGPDESSALIEVLPDVAMQGMLVDAALNFWNNHVLTDIPPPLTSSDVIETENPEILSMFRLVEKGADHMRPEIIKLGGHTKIRCGKYLLSKSITKTGKDSFRLTVKSE